MTFLKRIAARLPETWQDELKRLRCRRKIAQGRFVADEPEYEILHELINPGDWVVDIGANVGHYTKRFSELVGATGRVLAFEPVPSTFAILAANARLFAHGNVTLVNAAVSSTVAEVGFEIPKLATGLGNFYQAHVSEAAHASERVLSMRLDAIGIPHRVSLVKIDAEGHEAFVFSGMRELVEKDLPTMIVEGRAPVMTETLEMLGYQAATLAGSPNVLWRSPRKRAI